MRRRCTTARWLCWMRKHAARPRGKDGAPVCVSRQRRSIQFRGWGNAPVREAFSADGLVCPANPGGAAPGSDEDGAIGAKIRRLQRKSTRKRDDLQRARVVATALCRRARWVTQWNTPRISEAATVKTDPIIASP